MEFRIIAAFLLLCVTFGYGSNTCEPVKAPMCESMPYKLTRMPNRFHHNTQENAVLAIGQFDALVNTQCSSVIRFFLCTMFVPICAESDSQEQQDMIPPCRSVCESAREGCLPIMLRYNVTWPENLACENLPQHKEGVCVMPDAIIADPSSEPSKEISEPDDKWRDRNNPRQRGRNPEERKGTKWEKKEERRRRKHDKQERKLQEKEERRLEKQERRQQRQERRQGRGRGGQEEKEDDDDEESDRESKKERNEKSDDDRKVERNEEGSGKKSKKEKKLKKKHGKESAVMEGSAPCVCQNPGQIKRQLKTQDFNFVVKVSWIGLERTTDGSSLMKFNLLDTLDVPDAMEIKAGEKITLMTNKTCICPRFKEDHEYLVAGYTNQNTNGLVVYEVALKWKPAMKMWMNKMKGKPGRKHKVDKRKERQKKKESRNDHEARRGKGGKVVKGKGNRGGRKGERSDESDERKFNKGDKDQIATDEDNIEDEETTHEKTDKMTKKERKRKKWEKKQEKKGRKAKGQNGEKKRKLSKGRMLETTVTPLLEWTTTAISTTVNKHETENYKLQIDTEEDPEISFEEEQEAQKLGITMGEEKGEDNEPNAN